MRNYARNVCSNVLGVPLLVWCLTYRIQAVSHVCTSQESYQDRYTSSCGFWNWDRCTRHRTKYRTNSFCCSGWRSAGSDLACDQDTSIDTTYQTTDTTQTTGSCDSPMPYTDFQQRLSSTIRISGETPLSDRFITEGWYGQSNVKLLEVDPPGINHCGAIYPLYLKDAVYSNSSLSTATVCAQSDDDTCLEVKEIETNYCQELNMFVYYLKPVDLSEAAYCIVEIGDNYPTFNTSVNVDVLPLSETNKEYQFVCDFMPSTEEEHDEIWYTVTWYIDSMFVKKFPAVQKTADIKAATLLTEDEAGVTSVGFQIRCGYSVSYELDSEQSPSTDSEDRFIGIEILTPVLDVQQDTNATIVIRSTVEIGFCDDCKLEINLIKPSDNDACLPHPRVSECVINLDGKNSTINYPMVVGANFPTSYGEKFAVQILRFKTPTFFFAHRLWENYEFGDVRISVTNNAALIEGKECYAVPDPHMSTFNRIRYEHQYTGIYTMYQNTEWHQELQIQTRPCWNNAAVTCVCGVAVRVGKEVYVMERCSANYWKKGYTQCDETAGVSLIEVKSLGSSKFKIRLPSSTTLSISRYWGQMLVHVFPSVADEDNAEGLCGNLNDNFFRTRNRATVPFVQSGMPTFANSWSVGDNGVISLFSNDVTNLDPVNTGLFICDCEDNVCQSDRRCDPVEVENFTSESTCTVNHFLRKRSTVNNGRRSATSGSHTIIKRQAETTWTNGWTENSATDYCNSVFLNSPVVQICKDIAYVNVQGALDNCILDIKLAGDTSFAPVAVETITTSCFHEVSYDTRYQQSTTSQPSIFDQIQLVACPLECYQHGTCNQGICTCDDGFGSLDCSISLNTPPLLDQVINDGYCDSTNSNCSEISAFGGDFVDSDSIRCKIRTFQLTQQGSLISQEQRIALPTFESIGEVTCPLLKPDSTSSIKPEVEYGIVHGISVSNNGDIFSNESLVVVYNSRCQQCNIVANVVQCAYKGDFCMSEGECYENGERHPIYNCYSCSVNGGSRFWKYNLDADCPAVPTTESASRRSTTESTGLRSTRKSTGFRSTGLGDNVWIIVGVSVAVAAVLSVVAVIVYFEYKKRHLPSRTPEPAKLYINY